MSTPRRQFSAGWGDEASPTGPPPYNINSENVSYPLYSDDPFRHDSQSLDKRLKEDSLRLFTTWDQKINVGVVNFKKDDPYNPERKSCYVNKAETLEGWFAIPIEPINSRFYLIKPSNPRVYSWSPLHISEELTRKLLDAHKVMPYFLDCLHSAGEKITDISATYAGCRYRLNHAKPRPKSQDLLGIIPKFIVQSYEICYNLSYVVKSGRRSSRPAIFQWSIREMSIYQKYDSLLKSNIWVLVKVSQRVEERIIEVSTEKQGFEDIENFEQNPMDMHLVFLSSANENWRSYFNSMEEFFRDKTTNAVDYIIRSRLDDPDKPPLPGCAPEPENDLTVDFKDVQELQKFEEDVQKLMAHLEHNQAVMKSLKELNIRFHKDLATSSKGDSSVLAENFNVTLEAYDAEIESHKRKVEGLLRRIRGRSRLLYNVLEFRTQESVSRHNERSWELQELKRRESDIMKKMNKRTLEDAVGVKIMTFVALLYLPLTFVATFLNSGILTFADSRNGVDFHRVGFSKESFILFVAITIPLLAVTLGIWHKWNKSEIRSMGNDFDLPVEKRKRILRIF